MCYSNVHVPVKYFSLCLGTCILELFGYSSNCGMTSQQSNSLSSRVSKPSSFFIDKEMLRAVKCFFSRIKIGTDPFPTLHCQESLIAN
jgi:hypothetical protein